MRIYNKNFTKPVRKELRKNQTEEEKALWSFLRGKKTGYKFFRQYSVGKFILDFYCSEKRLGVEIDGRQHLDKDIKIYDKNRTEYFGTLGIKVLRFSNEAVKNTLTTVLNEITNDLIK